jgi:hypothetical protein
MSAAKILAVEEEPDFGLLLKQRFRRTSANQRRATRKTRATAKAEWPRRVGSGRRAMQYFLISARTAV